MAIVVKAEITIKGKKLENFSRLSINQSLFNLQDLELVCRPDVFDTFSVSGEKFAWDTAKEIIGKKIKIDISPIGKESAEKKSVTVFHGLITRVNGSRRNDAFSGELTISANSFDVFLTSKVHCRSFEDVKLSELVSNLLRDYPSNLFEKKMISPVSDQLLPYVVQYNETNFEFVCRLAKTYGEWIVISGDNKFYFGEPPDHAVGVLHGKDLLDISYSLNINNLDFHYKSYDYFNEKLVEKNASFYKPNLEGLLNTSSNASEEVFDQEDSLYFNQPLTQTNAGKDIENAIQIDKKGRVSRLNLISGSSDNCEITLGTVVKVDSFIVNQGKTSTVHMGDFRIISIMHNCDESGNYYNTFEAVPHNLESPPQTNPWLFPLTETQSAVVTDTNDPDGLGRIRVRFFWQTEKDQTPWLRIVTPYAGKNKGFYFVPEIGEEVLIGFENANAQKPYVIGSHFTGKSKPDDWKSDKNFLKALRTKSGHTIEFNDENGKETITIHDKDKVNTILFSSHSKELVMECKGDLKINAQNIQITAEKDFNLDVKGKILVSSQKETEVSAVGNVKLKSNKNIAVEAMSNLNAKANSKTEISGTTLTAKGSATAEFSAGGQTVVKGAIVRIN